MQRVSSKIFRALGLLKPYDIDIQKRLVGSERDGAYVMADNLCRNDVFSIGVDHNDDFDLELAKADHQIFMFDHTVDGPLHTHDNFRFHKIGICKEGAGTEELQSLEWMLKHCSVGKGLILKIDVEGAEWDVFSTMPSYVLSCFDQILVEIHWLQNLTDPTYRWNFCEALRRLNSQFTLFHVHANNNCEISVIDGFCVASVLELSFIRTDLVKPTPSQTVYPAWPNRANNPAYHDIPLLFYPFLPTSIKEYEFGEMVMRIEQDYDTVN